ncbi:MAG: HAD family phosphatase [Candidatus Thorarchaeota archaeon]|nr:HAD family phosphatase [Candidatus Thorarchaeota archaeon]
MIELAIFDVDGTLTTHSSIWWRLHEHFGTEKKGQKYFDRYFAGEIDYDQWAELDASLWKGQAIDDARELVQSSELTPGAIETVESLRNDGVKLGIVSGGLDIAANHVGKNLGIDCVMTNRLLHRDGRITGEVDVQVGWGAKGTIIRKIAEHFDVSLEHTAYIGDGRNDVSAFSHVGLSIAFCPEHKEVADAADVVISENDLRLILPWISDT